MAETTFYQTDRQRDILRRLLIEFVEGRTTGPVAARFVTRAELFTYGTVDLDYPGVIVNQVIDELELQRLLMDAKETTT